MTDTPRMQSALMDDPTVGFANVWKVGCDIERELIAANDRIKRILWLDDSMAIKIRELQARIKQLEDAGDALAKNPNPFTFIDWEKVRELR